MKEYVYHLEVDILTVLEFTSTPSRESKGSIFITFLCFVDRASR
jgi:hypothetical protein